MDPITLIFIWIVIVGVVVGLVVWFGPRPSQWRTHEGVDQAGNGTEPQEDTSDSDAEHTDGEHRTRN